MFKIRIFVLYLFVSLLSFAQISKIETSPVIKIDTVGTKLNFPLSKDFTITKLLDNNKSTNQFFILNAKPKKDSLYAALKGKKRDDSIYNMPNEFQKKIEIEKK
ncbi:MAG: hypothetical protein H7195_05880 [Chryseobacterium sp.]|nr:hypothetical protein [Chryseobacterium sp.]